MHTTLETLDILVITVYFIVLIFIGFYPGKDKKAEADLFLGGRTLSWPMIGFSIFSTNVSPMMLIGFCGVAYSSGVVASNFEWMAWPFLLLLAMVFVPHYLNTRISTMPEFLNVRYGGRCYRFLSCYALFSILVLWIGAALFAGGLIISQVVGWPYPVAVVMVGAFATSYTAVGGLKAVVRTDVYQSVLIIAASCILTLLALYRIGGVGKLAASVPPGYWHLFQGSESAYPWYALVLGYPVIGIQYWCTDQTIVQRVLGAKSTTEGQKGALFTAFLKVLMPFIFIFPGVMCFVLYPGLENPDHAYMTLITGLLPAGLIGLVVAALFAALINTVASALNSFSTLFTLDVYKTVLRPGATDGQVRTVGQWATVASAAAGVGIALFFGASQKNLFDLVQGVASYVAPPLSTVFVVGVLWKRATPKAAEWTLIGGGLLCVALGGCYLLDWPRKGFWPPFMLFTFYLFALLVVFMVVASLLTRPQPQYALPTLKETYARAGEGSKRSVWLLWGVVALLMVSIYVVFN